MLNQRDVDLLKLEAEMKVEDIVTDFEQIWAGQRQPLQQPAPMPEGEQPWQHGMGVPARTRRRTNYVLYRS